MRVRLVATAALLLAGVSTAASAQVTVRPVWLPPVELTPRTDYSIYDQDVAVDARQNVLAVWGGKGGVAARFRPAGGDWQASVQLAPCGFGERVAFDAAGNATVAWFQCDANGADGRLTTEVRHVNGSWSTPVPLSTQGRVASYLRLQVAGSGAAVASWAETDGHVWVIQAATRPPVSEAWTPAVQLSSVGADAYESSAAVDDTGDAVVGWTRGDPAGAIVWTAFKPSGGAWGSAVNMSPPGELGLEITVAMRAGGTAVAVWEQSGEGRSAVRPAASGTWSQPGSFPSYFAHDLVTDDAGDILAVWDDYLGIHAAELPAGSYTWGPAFNVSTQSSSPLSYAVRFDKDSGLVAVWGMQDNAGNGFVAASRRPAGATEWEQAVTLQVAGTFNNLYLVGYAVDATGDVVAVYQSPNGASVGAAVLDATAPKLASLSFRQTGRVGQRLPFAASPVDISAVSFRWFFGDGRRATGATVQHVYKKAGRYAVTLVATDAAGHSATVARTSVRISPRRS